MMFMLATEFTLDTAAPPEAPPCAAPALCAFERFSCSTCHIIDARAVAVALRRTLKSQGSRFRKSSAMAAPAHSAWAANAASINAVGFFMVPLLKGKSFREAVPRLAEANGHGAGASVPIRVVLVLRLPIAVVLALDSGRSTAPRLPYPDSSAPLTARPVTVPTLSWVVSLPISALVTNPADGSTPSTGSLTSGCADGAASSRLMLLLTARDSAAA